MKTRIKDALNLDFEPVATLWLDDAPGDALSFSPGKRGCLMSLFATTATTGKIACLNNDTVGCPGGGVGLGYGNHYADNFPGGEDCFCHFLSSGNTGFPKGEQIAGNMAGMAPEAFLHEYLHGERYMKSPDLVKDFIFRVGIMDIDKKYTVFMPLAMAEQQPAEPVTVSIVCNAAQLSALVILCNYFRKGIENVAIPYVAGCQSIGVMTYHEIDNPAPRGIVGMLDLTARKTVLHRLGRGKLTFSVPYKLFREMEENIPGSFLEKSPWLDLR